MSVYLKKPHGYLRISAELLAVFVLFSCNKIFRNTFNIFKFQKQLYIFYVRKHKNFSEKKIILIIRRKSVLGT